jgi:hypothetical protein
MLDPSSNEPTPLTSPRAGLHPITNAAGVDVIKDTMMQADVSAPAVPAVVVEKYVPSPSKPRKSKPKRAHKGKKQGRVPLSFRVSVAKGTDIRTRTERRAKEKAKVFVLKRLAELKEEVKASEKKKGFNFSLTIKTVDAANDPHNKPLVPDFLTITSRRLARKKTMRKPVSAVNRERAEAEQDSEFNSRLDVYNHDAVALSDDIHDSHTALTMRPLQDPWSERAKLFDFSEFSRFNTLAALPGTELDWYGIQDVSEGAELGTLPIRIFSKQPPLSQ